MSDKEKILISREVDRIRTSVALNDTLTLDTRLAVAAYLAVVDSFIMALNEKELKNENN